MLQVTQITEDRHDDFKRDQEPGSATDIFSGEVRRMFFWLGQPTFVTGLCQGPVGRHPKKELQSDRLVVWKAIQNVTASPRIDQVE